jgi:hypothetical protein
MEETEVYLNEFKQSRLISVVEKEFEKVIYEFNKVIINHSEDKGFITKRFSYFMPIVTKLYDKCINVILKTDYINEESKKNLLGKIKSDYNYFLRKGKISN